MKRAAMVKENVFTIFVHDNKEGHASRNIFQQLKGWTPDVVRASGTENSMERTSSGSGADREGPDQERSSHHEDLRIPGFSARWWLGR